jgi:hypothetical protein
MNFSFRAEKNCVANISPIGIHIRCGTEEAVVKKVLRQI